MTSSVNNVAPKDLLQDFLEGRRPLSEIQERLQNRLQIDFHLAPAHRKIVKNELENETIQITVKKAHLRHMLQRYLDGEVSELELSNWAALIYMLPVFIPEGETEDEQWEAGSGPTWTILQELVTPELFGGLGPKIVQQYLESLG